MTLQAHGYETIVANGAESAMSIAGAHRPNMIMMGIGLSTATGYELAAALHREAAFRKTV